MKASRRNVLKSLSLSLASATATAAVGLTVFSAPVLAHNDENAPWRSGMVFSSSNALAGNELLVYARASDGALSLRAHIPTGGQGSGAGLGSQGAVTLSADGRYLYVVNALSNSLSTFELDGRELRLASVVASGGLHPISVTEAGGLVYVLNDAGAGNVAGFRNVRGDLLPVAGSLRGLSVAGGAAPAQVGFSDDSDALIVTEKGTNRLTSYRVNADGSIGAPQITPSPGLTPFGFAFNRRNRLLVTEAVGGAAGASTVSSYRFSDLAPALPVLVSGRVPDTQSAACWIAITPNGRYAFVANTGSSSVSSYQIASGGQIALTNATAGSTGAGSAPADAAISPDGRELYVRNGRTFTLSSFSIGPDGSLAARVGASGLPASAVGLAAN
jgi:6-phosphogluconolactonase (cycloisomerase 2 family)